MEISINNFISLLFALFLVFLNGLFVAAEFSMVKLRATQVNSIFLSQGWKGSILQKVHSNLDAYLSACQLGITLASLGLGWVGEKAFSSFLVFVFGFLPVSADVVIILSVIFSFVVISFLHIVIGELAPKSWAIRDPMKISLWTSIPLYFFYWATYPAIYLLNSSSNLVLKLFGILSYHSNKDIYSEQEVKLILNSTKEENPSEQNTLLSAMAELGELEVADWTNSKEDLIYFDENDDLNKVLSTFRKHKYSRFPVFSPLKDKFIGLIHIKDILLFISKKQNKKFRILDYLHIVEKVSKNTALFDLLNKFKEGNAHFALVVESDENILGFITMEDVLEVIFGDIQDEYRKIERGVLVYSPGKILARGDTSLFKIEKILNINLDNIESDTVAGMIYEVSQKIPNLNEIFYIKNLTISIKKMKGPKIMLVKITKSKE